MHEVKSVMTRSVYTVEPATTLARAASEMNRLGIEAMPVLDGERVVGVITDRDITLRATAQGLDPKHALVQEVMTRGVISCSPDDTVEDVAKLMQKYRIRHLPVLSVYGHLVGIVSLDDLAAGGSDAKLAGGVLETMARKQRPEQPTYQHIIVALDGSELAEQVLSYVETLARQLQSRVTLVRAVTPFEGFVASLVEADSLIQPGTYAVGTVVPIPEEIRTQAAQYLAAVQARLQSKGIAVDFEYPDAEPGQAIVQQADRLGADLIAMTTHGRGGLSRAVHGSVADEVLRKAPCAVMLVRAHNPD